MNYYLENSVRSIKTFLTKIAQISNFIISGKIKSTQGARASNNTTPIDLAFYVTSLCIIKLPFATETIKMPNTRLSCG